MIDKTSIEEYEKFLNKKNLVNKESLLENFKKADDKKREEMYDILDTTDTYNELN
ncbi:unnamed protein product [marine sediment metagenome]|uniref:Uncharacterized protein n=1 Tax=marine sediment metagenome TaxID=412755 RepID=X0UTQ4_9ZZZZ